MRSRETWGRIPGGSWIPAFAGMTASARNAAATIPAQASPVVPASARNAAATIPAQASPVVPASARNAAATIPAQVSPVIPAKAGIHVGPRHRGIGAPSSGFRILVLALAIATTGGCGYQLRGAVSLPSALDGIHVTGPAGIGDALTQMLESRGAGVRPERESAKAVLWLGHERFTRRVLSVDPDTGKEREIELAYSVAFRVAGGDGEELMPEQTVSLLRDYVVDADAVLGKSREEDVLREEMRRAAAGQITRRVATALGR